MNSMMNFLENRLLTYRFWPRSDIDYMKLAKAGFFYTNYRDCVQCYYCSILVSQWDKNDVPEIEHARLSKSCMYNQYDITHSSKKPYVDGGRDEIG